MTRRAETLSTVRTALLRLPALIALAAALSLSACGGGGGGGSKNKSPVASFTTTPGGGSAPLAVNVDASASSDPDGSITKYAWSFGDSATGTGVTASHTYSTAGSYTITLTVTDNGGKTAKSTYLLSVSDNTPPTASFTATPAVLTVPATVSVDAAGSTDSDGTITGYAWDFGDGTTGTGQAAAHTYTRAGVFTIKLTVTDNGGDTGTVVRDVMASQPAPAQSVAITGKVTYDRVPFNPNGSGLLYTLSSIQNLPVRGVVVELLRSDQTVLGVTTTDAQGNYGFAAPQNTNVFVRVRAQVLAADPSSGAPTWDIVVRNNANSNALYVMDGSVFSTGTTSVVRPTMNAQSGWIGNLGANGQAYTTARVAAPFAILDTLYTVLRFLSSTQGDPSIALPPLQVFWSPLNQASDSWDPSQGNIQTTLYRPDEVSGFPAGVYVLGKDGVDTDEYDEHVLAHEFNHFVQDNLSRDDTPGGPHSLGERVDLRLAFSEGFANAFSGMALDDPIYRDSFGSYQSEDFNFSLETLASPVPGWYSEASVQSIVWDLFDATADTGDSVTIPFSSMLSVLRGALRSGQPLTSIFPFIVGLKGQAGAPVSGINALVVNQAMVASTMDPFGSTETNSGSVDDVLPIYTNLSTSGSKVTVCGNHDAGTFNKIGNRRLLKFSLAAARTVTIRAKYNASGSTAPLTPTPDPDIVLYKGGFLASAESGAANEEALTRYLQAGDYVVEVYEYSHVDPSTTASRRGRTCFDVSLN